MIRKILYISMMCISTLTVFAHPFDQTNDTIYTQKVFTEEEILSPIVPSYLPNVSEAANWGCNWFIEVKGGASAFLGSPIGCGDVFDRITPAIQAGVGKWFTPAIGGRVEFQGLTFKNAEFRKMHYKFIHADFMYNITSGLQVNDKGLSRWDVIPFVGVGMIHNSDWKSTCNCQGRASGSHPFAFSYGIEVRYHVSDRVHAIAEVSGMTTAKNFDCVHPSSKFGDNMLTASVGLSFSIGKTGWKRVVDAKPYIEENVNLKKYISNRFNNRDNIQNKFFGDEKTKVTYPKNCYSGLLSLRSRLANAGNGNTTVTDGDNDEASHYSWHDYNGDDAMYSNDTISFPKGKTDVGVPVYFFFKLGTDELTESSQQLNIDGLARIAVKYGYKMKIRGAADSATGSEAINKELSTRRAEFIKRLMVDRGVDFNLITTHAVGGIDTFSPVEANRNSCVILFF